MALSWRKPPSTQAEEDDLFLLTLENDTEDAPWMVMGDLQFWSASGFAHSLRTYARAHGLPWYVAGMLPIRYRIAGSRRRKQLAPDCFVAFVPDRARQSYKLDAEGVFPAFVLEVVSPSSVKRDEQDKLRAYSVLGVTEYVLFTPRAIGASSLAGYRRDELGRLVPLSREADGSLWSDVLELRLVVEGDQLLAVTAEGERLLSPEQEAAARREAERARREAERSRLAAEDAREVDSRARLEAERARGELEAENARLRRELDRLECEGQ
jgi:Uma2 family endonuclease